MFSSIPDAVLVSGAITGEAARMADLEAVKAVLPIVPVLANTGVKHATVADVLRIADGCIVGSALKVDGDTWNAGGPGAGEGFHGRAVRAATGRPHEGSRLNAATCVGRSMLIPGLSGHEDRVAAAYRRASGRGWGWRTGLTGWAT